MNTKEKILQGFNELVRRSDFEMITAEKIAQASGVSRATFYRYFHDKYEVMNYNYIRLIDESMKHAELETMEDLFVILMKAGRTAWVPLLPLFQTHGMDSLRSFIAEYSFTVAKNMYECGDYHGEKKAYRKLDSAETLQLRMFCAGAAGFFEEWIAGKYRVTDREAAKAMYEILPPCMKGQIL